MRSAKYGSLCLGNQQLTQVTRGFIECNFFPLLILTNLGGQSS